MNSETLAVETSELTKTFGATRAVDALDLSVPAGAVYGVLGPNGAGKTTAVQILATLLRPDGAPHRCLAMTWIPRLTQSAHRCR